MKYPHLAARIFNTPLLIHPQKLDALIAGLGGRLLGSGDAPFQQLVASAEQPRLAPELFSTRRGERSERGYRIVEGVAVISISGVLVHRSRLEMADSTFFYGYNDLAADLEDAMNNPEVHAVLQVYDSPGGEAQGAFEYAQRVHAQRGKKPIWAIADGMAASAAYLGGSAAESVAVTSTGYAGSIGVVARHVDLSRALDAEGITVTHIFAGAHKIDGNPYEPLPASVRKDWQAEIDGLYTMFVDAVANHRALDEKAVRATQAAVFTGQAAVAAGLADRIATTDELITELAALRVRSYPSGQTTARATANQGAPMSGNTPAGGQTAAANPAAPTAQFSQSDLDAARAEGVKQGAQAERDRAAAILGHEAAKGRTELAHQCISTGLTVEQSAAILGASPAAAPAAAAQGGNQFAQHMNALGNPATTGTEAPPSDAGNPVAVAASWDAAFGIPQGRA
jgi:signal peptide peptidase SppA